MIKHIVIATLTLNFLASCGSSSYSNDDTTSGQANAVNGANLEKGKELYAKCVGCHGINGEKHALGKSDIIAGQNSQVTISQLKEYRAGTLNKHGMGALMKGQISGFSDNDIRDVSYNIETLSGYKP